MNKIKQYPSYKDSKIKWIGEIPEQWSSHRIKDFVEFEIGGTPSTSNEEFFEGNNIWISIADLTNNNKNTINNSKTKITDEAIKKSNVKLIKKGSLLFSFKLTVGETAFAGCDLYTNEAIASFKQNKNISLNYLKYLFKVGFENNAFENIYGAKIFNSDLIKFAKIIKPSFIEQEQIAKYLDTKTTKIEQTITKNKKLIDLLEEKRTSLINQVVTKGLNPNVKMKDSGIEWIGEIPEDWNIERLKKKCLLNNLTLTNETDMDYEFDYVDISSVSLERGIEKYEHMFFKDAPSRARRIVNQNDVIISTVRTYLKAIATIPNKKDVIVSTGFAVLTPKDIDSKYLGYIVKSEYFINMVSLNSKGISYPAINSSDLINLSIIIPPLIEQKEIVNYLDENVLKIQKIIDDINHNIKLLKEYKKSLIYNVVTGKVDIRGVDV